MDTTIGVRQLGDEHVARAAKSLANAFFDDPTGAWPVPSEDVRLARPKRIGSVLLSRMLELRDRDRVGAHLEAMTEANLRLYERHGFSIRQELDLPGDLHLWSMWREPR